MTPARSYLFSLEQIGIKLGLDQIRALVTALGNPDRAFASIVVAGTNGKGSVTAMIERGLREAGVRTGRYTSPHLIDIEERFAIDGMSISAATFDEAAARVHEASRQLPAPPSFFEATTALALELFREAGVGVAVLEVGMGGRLDATNVVQPVAVAITAVDFDHQEYLGDTLALIAREKAGVIKPGSVVVVGPNPPEVVEVIAETCAAAGVPLTRADQGCEIAARVVGGRGRLSMTTPAAHYGDMVIGLRGRHQIDNAITAIRLLEAFSGVYPGKIPPAAIRAGVEQVVWPGRLELLRWRGVDVLVDGAHNPAGARALASYLHDTYRAPSPMVVGIMGDKKIDEIIGALAPAAAMFVFTAARTPRAAPPADLLARAAAIAPGVPAIAIADPIAGLEHARAAGSPVVVAGSLYLAGEIRAVLS